MLRLWMLNSKNWSDDLFRFHVNLTEKLNKQIINNIVRKKLKKLKRKYEYEQKIKAEIENFFN